MDSSSACLIKYKKRKNLNYHVNQVPSNEPGCSACNFVKNM